MTAETAMPRENPHEDAFAALTASKTLLTLTVAGCGLAVIAGLALSPDAAGAVVGLALAGLLVCGVVDFASFRIPNAITYGGLVLVLAASLLLGEAAPGRAGLGALVGGGLMLALSLFSRGSLGLGDVKLSAFGGALVGSDFVLQALLAGAVGAAAVCLPLVLAGRLRRDQPIPFGPSLSFGFALVALATGTTLNI